MEIPVSHNLHNDQIQLPDIRCEFVKKKTTKNTEYPNYALICTHHWYNYVLKY